MWEKMDESMLVAALNDALPPLLDFTCTEDLHDPLNKHYVVYVELPAAAAARAQPPSQQQVAKWAGALQNALKARNGVYGQLADAKAIGPAVLRLVGDGSFAALKAARGSSAESQYKTPTVLRAWQLIELMDSSVVCEAAGQ